MAGVGDGQKTKAILKVPNEFMPIAFIIVGYASEKPLPPKRRFLNEVVGVNCFPGKNFPSTTNPNKWNLSLIADFQEKACRASVLGRKYIFYNPPVKEIVNSNILPELKGKILDVLSYDGHLLSLIAKQKNVFSWEMSGEVINFIKQKLELEKTKQVTFINDKKPDFKKNQFDAITLLLKLEMLNADEQKLIILNCFSALKKSGKLFVLINSKYSIRWLKKLYRLSLMNQDSMDKHFMSMWNVGPYRALNPNKIKKILLKLGFSKIVEEKFATLPNKISVVDKAGILPEYYLFVCTK